MDEIQTFLSRRLQALANPEKSGPMQAYMKTEMPFYGVQKPAREPVLREMVKRFVPRNRDEYERMVLSLWALPHREERYAALYFARRHRRFVVPDSMPLFERLIREGAWWDLVDDVAGRLISWTQLDHPDVIRPIMDAWIDDDFMWIRRSAIISQLRAKTETDSEQLFDYCRRRLHEKEFFIRKAIGWSLRQYSKSGPEAVRDFLTSEKANLSGLSYREGKKHLVRIGMM